MSVVLCRVSLYHPLLLQSEIVLSAIVVHYKVSLSRPLLLQSEIGLSRDVVP